MSDWLLEVILILNKPLARVTIQLILTQLTGILRRLNTGLLFHIV